MEDEGYGEGYVYDHDDPDAFSGQNYFPDGISGPGSTIRPSALRAEIRKRLDYWAACAGARAAEQGRCRHLAWRCGVVRTRRQSRPDFHEISEERCRTWDAMAKCGQASSGSAQAAAAFWPWAQRSRPSVRPCGLRAESRQRQGGCSAPNAALIAAAKKCGKVGEVCLKHCIRLTKAGDKSLADCSATSGRCWWCAAPSVASPSRTPSG